MGGKSSKNTTETNTIAEPWDAAQPFLKNLLGDSQNLYNQGGLNITPWQGMRVAPQSAMTQQAQQGIYNTASQGNPITPQAQAAFGDLAGGGNIYGDLAQVKQNALADIIPAISSRFGQAGMLDSTLAADAMGRGAAQAIAPIEYGAWNDAQNRRLGALSMAPQLSANAYLDPQMMAAAGQQQDQYGQSLLDAARGFDFEMQDMPYQELSRAASLGMGFGGMGGQQNSEQAAGGGGGVGGAIGGIMQMLPLLAFL